MRGKLLRSAKTTTSAIPTGQEMYGTQDFVKGTGLQCPSEGLRGGSEDTGPNNAESTGGSDWGPSSNTWDKHEGDCFDSTNQINGDDDGNEPCRHCRSVDHQSSACPDAPSGRGSRACFRCQQPGHMANECPSRSDGFSGDRRPDNRSCHKCQKTGHIAKDCPDGGRSYGSDRFRGADRLHGGGSQAAQCTNCGGRGHSENQCPSPREESYGSRSPQRPGSQQPSEAVCHRCQETGHYAHACPKRVGAETDDAESCGPHKHVIETSEEDAVNRNNTGVNFDRYKKIEVKVIDHHGVELDEWKHKQLLSFEAANFNPDIKAMIELMNYKEPTPVQKYAIPMLTEGRDVMACAQTGSGKTAAFVLPIIDGIVKENLQTYEGRPQRVHALILTPTRELTVQITKDAKLFCRRTKVQVKECYGGTHVFTQVNNIQRGCHVLVGTTGRVKDFLNREVLSLSDLRYLVLDEADRMLDMGFSTDVNEIMSHHSRDRQARIQTVMFSATFPKEVQQLARKLLRPDFLKLDVGIVGTVNQDVTQFVETHSGLGAKKDRLIDIIETEIKGNPKAKILVFVETKRTADSVATFLSEMEIKATSIHGDRLQQQREKALKDFQEKECPVLVATSVAARGLDISEVGHVINFDLPKSIDEYVHRVGRTGRVGNTGKATSFYDPNKDYEIQDALRQSFIDAGQLPPDFL